MLISLTSAAAVLGVHRMTVLRWIRQGRVAAQRLLGNRWGIEQEDLRGLVKRPPGRKKK